MSQYETAASIFDALEIMNAWNTDVSPKNAMVDFATEEISALKMFSQKSLYLFAVSTRNKPGIDDSPEARTHQS